MTRRKSAASKKPAKKTAKKAVKTKAPKDQSTEVKEEFIIKEEEMDMKPKRMCRRSIAVTFAFFMVLFMLGIIGVGAWHLISVQVKDFKIEDLDEEVSDLKDDNESLRDRIKEVQKEAEEVKEAAEDEGDTIFALRDERGSSVKESEYDVLSITNDDLEGEKIGTITGELISGWAFHDNQIYYYLHDDNVVQRFNVVTQKDEEEIQLPKNDNIEAIAVTDTYVYYLTGDLCGVDEVGPECELKRYNAKSEKSEVLFDEFDKGLEDYNFFALSGITAINEESGTLVVRGGYGARLSEFVTDLKIDIDGGDLLSTNEYTLLSSVSDDLDITTELVNQTLLAKYATGESLRCNGMDAVNGIEGNMLVANEEEVEELADTEFLGCSTLE
ncbi:hypothetical protein ACFL2D_01945 [Patescibacteria group bacterium]